MYSPYYSILLLIQSTPLVYSFLFSQLLLQISRVFITDVQVVQVVDTELVLQMYKLCFQMTSCVFRCTVVFSDVQVVQVVDIELVLV